MASLLAPARVARCGTYRLTGRCRVLVLCLALLLGGCSGVQLVYDRLDWLLPWYLDDYVELTDAQNRLLDRELAELLVWHRRTELPRYAAWLRELRDDLDDGLTRAELDRHEQRLEAFWRALMKHMAAMAAPLLASLSDTQIEQLFAALAERNRRYEKRYVEPEPVRVVSRRVEQTSERLEFWLGDLTSEQIAIVRRWSHRYAALGSDNLAFRQQWQQRLRQLLDGDRTRHFEAALRRLLVEPEAAQPARLDGLRARIRVLLQELLLTLEPTLTSSQRRYLHDRLTTLADDFEQLAQEN